jgi:hypothetical protein
VGLPDETRDEMLAQNVGVGHSIASEHEQPTPKKCFAVLGERARAFYCRADGFKNPLKPFRSASLNAVLGGLQEPMASAFRLQAGASGLALSATGACSRHVPVMGKGYALCGE